MTTKTTTTTYTTDGLLFDGCKDTVESWDTVATFVATFPDGDTDGACDVEIQAGQGTGGQWYLRTRDDAGGCDDLDATAYDCEASAREAAEAHAAAASEAEDGEDAEGYLRRRAEERVGAPSPSGAWCAYWSTVGDESGPRRRYATQDQAEAAVELANHDLAEAHPGGNLLCGYEVRCLVDGEWLAVDSDA